MLYLKNKNLNLIDPSDNLKFLSACEIHGVRRM